MAAADAAAVRKERAVRVAAKIALPDNPVDGDRFRHPTTGLEYLYSDGEWRPVLGNPYYDMLKDIERRYATSVRVTKMNNGELGKPPALVQNVKSHLKKEHRNKRAKGFERVSSTGVLTSGRNMGARAARKAHRFETVDGKTVYTYTVKCVETGEEFASMSAAARAFNISVGIFANRVLGKSIVNDIDGFHFTVNGNEEPYPHSIFVPENMASPCKAESLYTNQVFYFKNIYDVYEKLPISIYKVRAFCLLRKDKVNTCGWRILRLTKEEYEAATGEKIGARKLTKIPIRTIETQPGGYLYGLGCSADEKTEAVCGCDDTECK